MKSEWRVTSNVIGGQKMYAAYRLLDVAETDHSGNREFAGEYIADRGIVEAAVRALNEKEGAD